MEKKNIAFKCNFCNGGSDVDKMHYGYNGVCTSSVIEYNIEKMKYEWCTHPRCACYQYYTGRMSYSALKDQYRRDGSVCYESAMLKNWEALAGWDNKGKNGDRPRRILGTEVGNLAILTLVPPNMKGESRRIFALFLIDEYEEGDGEEYEGRVASRGEFKLHFSRKEASSLSFWDYYRNENTDEQRWGSGLFRYLDDEAAARILRQAMLLKTGTKDEKLARRMFENFCQIKNLNATGITSPLDVSEKVDGNRIGDILFGES